MCLAWIDTGHSKDNKTFQLYGCFKQADASALNNLNTEQTLIGSKPVVKISLSPNADGAIISLIPTDRGAAAEAERTIRNVFNECAPHVSSLETGPLPPPPQALHRTSTSSAPARSNEHNASTQSTSSTQSKYSHVLSDHWFTSVEDSGIRRLMSASIADSTARTYDATVAKYVRFSSAKGFDAVRPAVSDCVEFFSHLASESMAAASSVAHAAVKKFIAINGGPSTAIDSDAVRAVMQGAANLNLSSRSQRRHRLAMTKSAMAVARHVILTKGWAEQDGLMVWSLLLTCFWGSIRCGDVLSTHVNTMSPKTLTWDMVEFEPSLVRVRLLQPKASADGKGYVVPLLAKEEARFCPRTHLLHTRRHSKSAAVFSFASGKLLTIALVNSILAETSRKVGIPAYANYSGHSLRAAVPTAMGGQGALFSDNEMRAVGNWRSNAAFKYVRNTTARLQSVESRLCL